jgi:uncharacterized protein (TIRG00374 family)
LLVSRKNLFPHLYQKLAKTRFFHRYIANWGKKTAALRVADVPITTYLQANINTTAKCFFLQLAIFGADVFTAYSLFQGMGVSVSFFEVMLCLACTKIVSLLPFLPGSLVLYESSMSLFFVALHISLGSAIIVTLLYRFLSFWLPIPFGLLLYYKWRIST